MFTIDLLKGQGIPTRNRPENVAIISAAFAAPVIVAVILLGIYIGNRIDISVANQEMVKYQQRIEELADAVRLKNSFEQETTNITECMSEAAEATGRHMQWTPVLVTLAQNLPKSIRLKELDVKQDYRRERVRSKQNKNEWKNVVVPVRKMKLVVSGRPGVNCDRVVRDFSDRLRYSDVLKDKIEEVKISQDMVEVQGREVVAYRIDCVFKQGL